MEHIIFAKNTTVTEGIRVYVEKRFEKFSKYAPDDTKVYTKIEVKSNRPCHKVEVTIVFGKQTLRAEAADVNMYVAIDNVEKTMARLLKKRKEKMVQRRQMPGDMDAVANAHTEEEYDIARVKTHELPTMSAQDACEAMEMVGHAFYVYRDVDTKKLSVVYLREDGDYGQLIYE